ncbi:hypothetical protein KBC75_00710 [Candidatus Shapirobacteria bacterium]|nr:hypothetical protein [Candidatus Shapirobacteria bacterium]
MSQNPLLNALASSAYIFLITFTMNWASNFFAPKDSPFAPILFLSLLSLSVVTMAYLFCLQPILMYLDGHKKDAVKLFLQTIGIFAIITLVIFLLLLTKTI